MKQYLILCLCIVVGIGVSMDCAAQKSKTFKVCKVEKATSQANSNPKKVNYNNRATTSEFTNGLSQADVLWNYHGIFFNMEVVAGFVGCQQDSTTLSLRPEIAWIIIDKQTKPSKEDIEAYEEGGDKEYLEGEK